MRNLMSIFLFLSLLSGSVVIADDDFFSDNFSAREMQSNQRNRESLTKSLEVLNAMQLLFLYESLEKGECGKFLDIEGKAKQGDAESQWILSDIYNKGICVNKDNDKAFEWVSKAAENGYKNAIFDIGVFYLRGRGTPQNSIAAYTWMLRAGNNGETRAYRILSGMYMGGKGTTTNYEESLKWSLKGAENGDDGSQMLAANLLGEEGLSFYDPIEAYKWALLASQSSEDEIKEPSLELIERFNGERTYAEVQKAQALATAWLNNKNHIENDEFTLPVLSNNLSDTLSQKQALNELEALRIGKDRELFFRAVCEDNLGLFKMFIKAGASIETTGLNDNSPPLYRSVSCGSNKVFEYLLSKGANINHKVNNDGDTPILIALSNGHFGMAEKLLALGADISHPGIIYNAVESNNRELLEKFYAAGATSIDKDYVGTPLLNAVRVRNNMEDLTKTYCSPESTEFLLEKGASPNYFDKYGRSILSSAIWSENPIQCVSLLLEYNTDVQYKLPYGRSALADSVMLGNPEIVKLLLKYGANPNETYSFNDDQIPMIITNEVSRNILKNKGTPLMLAVSEGHASAAYELFNNGGDLDIETETGLSALTIAKNNNDRIILNIFGY